MEGFHAALPQTAKERVATVRPSYAISVLCYLLCARESEKDAQRARSLFLHVSHVSGARVMFAALAETDRAHLAVAANLAVAAIIRLANLQGLRNFPQFSTIF